MPDMDGYALAEAIRQEESGRQRIPIIALTANALRGEANRALAAGMDAYLTNPVDLSVLREALNRWLGEPAFAADSAAVVDDAQKTAAPTFEISVLENLVGADPHVVREFLSDYLRTAAEHAASLRAAYSASDAAKLVAVAHKLKSSSRSAGALAMGRVCAALDAAGQAGDGARIAELVAEFEAVYLATKERISRTLLDAT
jgi:response regulator RpfG family c-di-GMP phosphodiesterase